MASPVSTPTFSCSSSIRSGKPSISALSSSYSLQSSLTSRRFRLSKQSSLLAQCSFASWAGLRSMGISISPKFPETGKRERCKRLTVHASLFGVGAPEALVIGVVALLVFGPKGLAEVARNLGKTLRAFQPTIRELQDVSREFKSSLEREIGLDDIPNSSQSPYSSGRSNSVSSAATSKPESPQTVSDPNGVPPNRAYSSEEYLKITEEQLKASVAPQANVEEKQAPVQDSAAETASASPQKPENEA